MTAARKRRATYEDVLAAPEHLVAEILFGVLYTHPRPASRHTIASSHLGAELSGPFDRGRGGPGGWLILDEPELHLGEDIIVPDLAGWRRTRAPDVDGAFITMPPDWVCEVLSPRTEATDRSDKMTIYGREGIPHAWLVDPVTKTLEVFRLRKSRTKKKKTRAEWVLVGVWRDEAKVRAVPFDAIALELGSIWR